MSADKAALDDAVVGDLEAYLVVVGTTGGGLGVPGIPFLWAKQAVHLPPAPVAVEPLEVQGVQRVLVALQPVAGQGHGPGGAYAGPHEYLVARQQRRGQRPEIGEDEAAQLLYGVGLQLDLVLEARADRLRRLVEAVAVHVEEPAVVGAADAFGLGHAVGKVGLAVGARRLDKPDLARGAPEQHEILAEVADLLGGVLVVDLGRACDGVPVAAHQLAHGRSGSDPGQSIVLLLRQHGSPLQITAPAMDRILHDGPATRGGRV